MGVDQRRNRVGLGEPGRTAYAARAGAVTGNGFLPWFRQCGLCQGGLLKSGSPSAPGKKETAGPVRGMLEKRAPTERTAAATVSIKGRRRANRAP